jgi:hypothetical protein
MSARTRFLDVASRLLVAGLVCAVVAGISYLCAFLSLRDDPNYRGLEVYTKHELNKLDGAIVKHWQRTGRLPASLVELEDVKGQHRLDDSGQVVDLWGHPYQYHVADGTYTLYSFGQDGQTGGDGLDADIYPPSVGRPFESPTLHQFTFALPTEGVRLTCLLAGVCAGLVCLLPARNRLGPGFLARMGATVVGAVLIAVVISSLHIPTGH